jgi:acyl-coenzyme A synthetase/AMP-(fatty) acid ligase
MNLAQTVLDAGREDPDHIAVKLDDAEVSYKMLDGATAHMVGLLRERGVKPGDRVGIMLPNVPYFRGADERAAQKARGRLLPQGSRGQAADRLG